MARALPASFSFPSPATQWGVGTVKVSGGRTSHYLARPHSSWVLELRFILKLLAWENVLLPTPRNFLLRLCPLAAFLDSGMSRQWTLLDSPLVLLWTSQSRHYLLVHCLIFLAGHTLSHVSCPFPDMPVSANKYIGYVCVCPFLGTVANLGIWWRM